MEKWKDIEGYEGIYQVSSEGRVKSLNYRQTGKEKILKNRKNNHGYLYVVLCKEGKVKNCSIHRLVAFAFIDNPNNLPQVNHINEIKTDNRVENLEWCDRSYNCNYGSRNERMAKSRSIPILQFTKEGEFVKKWESAIEASRELNISQPCINECCNRKQKTCGGYVWMYAKVGVFEIDVNKLKRVA